MGDGLGGHLGEDALDHGGDPGEGDAAVEEGGDGYLVGGIEDGRRGAAGLPRLERQAQADEGVRVGLLEGQRTDRREVETRHVDRHPFGEVQRVGDRHPHVGVTQVREGRAVDQVDHRVDQRLRVDDDVDPFVGDAEEVVRLDHLEALVHQRRAVDRDPAAHLPGRVVERLGDAYGAEIVAAAEGAAGGGDQQAVDGAGSLGADQLVERRVLGVDRQEPRSRRLGERHHQLAAEHQALLVGERDVDPGAERGDGRAEPGGADDAVEDEVRLGCRDQPPYALLTGEHGPLPRLGGARRGIRVGERNRRDAVPPGLAHGHPPATPGGQPDGLQFRRRLDHLERLRPDRPRRAEYQHLLHLPRG